jgi:hypothetical protein
VSTAYYPEGTYVVAGYPTQKRFIPGRREIDTLRVQLPQRKGGKRKKRRRVKTVRSDILLFRLLPSESDNG